VNTVVGYRVGTSYTLEPGDEDAEPVTIALADAVRVARSGAGRLLCYRGVGLYGLEIETALAAGWCWLLEDGRSGLILSDAEGEALVAAYSSATNLAEDGDARAGYEALLAGLRRAEELRDAGKVFGAELVTRWRYVLERYTVRYRL
jgi:hypothetical protein